MKKKILFFIATFFLLPIMAQATTIAPAVLQVNLNPGQSGKYFLSLFNETASDLYLSGSIGSFRPQGESGQAQLVPPAVNNQSLSWLKMPVNSVLVKADQVVQIPLEINVPKNAEVGGYYLAALWQTASSPKRKTSQLNFSSQVGSLILLRVNGNVKEQLRVASFGSEKNRSVYDALPVNFNLKLKNEGNIHESPRGFVVIKNCLGRVVDALPVNSEKGNILPASTRQFAVVWTNGDNAQSDRSFISGLRQELKNPLIGPFTVQAQLAYGDKRQALESEKISLWLIPWRISLIVLIILLLIIVWRVVVWRKKRRRRKMMFDIKWPK